MYSWEQKLADEFTNLRPMPPFGQEPGPIVAAGLEEHTINLRMRPVRRRVRHQLWFATGLLVMGILLPFALEESGFIEDAAVQSFVRAVFFGAALLLIIYSRRNTDPFGLRDKKPPMFADQSQVTRKIFGSPWGLEEYESPNTISKRLFKRKNVSPEGSQEEQLTFAGLERLCEIPGTKIIYGEIFPDEEYSGIVHTVMCGHKVALVETLPYSRSFTPQDRSQAMERLNNYKTFLVQEISRGIAKGSLPEVRGIIVSYDEKEQFGLSISSVVEKLGDWFASDTRHLGVVDRQLLACILELNRQS